MHGVGLAAVAAVLLVVSVASATPVPLDRGASSVSAPVVKVGWINISAVGMYGYSPANLEQVPTNAKITVTFTDQSQMAHTFTIIGKEGWVVPTTYSPAQIDALAYGGSPPALVDSNVSGPGDVNVTTFESPGPGWYEFICTVSGHFQQGMYGFVAFGMNLPSNLTPTNRTTIGGGLSFSPLDALVIVLVVALGASLYVVWRRRRSRLMPPGAQH
jgi:plastocyanin